ncbi:MAG: peptidoglycan bridge formation glycyltransferase FemA/FemB family protein [Nanohaloarchaea archaeon]|nr:peptidoglycan bridge formation glycyltransferase FemA/FemB family protein [Candidatus Nanohaloarchaea archaeon]
MRNLSSTDNRNKKVGFFQGKEWCIALEKNFGYKIYYLESRKSAFPVALVRSRIFGNRLVSLPFSDSSGPYGTPEDVDLLLKKLVAVSETEDIDFVEVRDPGKIYYSLFEKHGFIKRDDYVTFVIDLKNKEETLLQNMEKRVRNDINKSGRSGLKIIEATSKEHLHSFYSIYSKTMKRLGSPPQSFRFFFSIWNMFDEGGRIKIYLVEHEKKYIAGGLFIYDKKSIHYSYGCSLSSYSRLRAPDFLIWHVISKGIKEGFESFCFGRTRRDSGVFKYKKGWGGELKVTPYFYLFKNKILDQRQETKYKHFSRLWARYMPESIAKLVGPWLIRQIG